jgi:hypothetical protein
MRIATSALLALGVLGSAAIGGSAPAAAQSVSFYGPGVGVEIITRPAYHRHYRYDRYYGGMPYAYRYYRTWDGRYSVYETNPPSTY